MTVDLKKKDMSKVFGPKLMQETQERSLLILLVLLMPKLENVAVPITI